MQATFSRAYWQQKQKHKTNTVANYAVYHRLQRSWITHKKSDSNDGFIVTLTF